MGFCYLSYLFIFYCLLVNFYLLQFLGCNSLNSLDLLFQRLHLITQPQELLLAQVRQFCGRFCRHELNLGVAGARPGNECYLEEEGGG